MPTLVKDLTD